jgi:hypothetical protein
LIVGSGLCAIDVMQAPLGVQSPDHPQGRAEPGGGETAGVAVGQHVIARPVRSPPRDFGSHSIGPMHSHCLPRITMVEVI